MSHARHGRPCTFIRSWLYRPVLALTVVICMTGTVNATLISVDLNTAGDGLLTRDSASGLEWLDVTQTTDTSFNAISGQFGTGDPFEGFRYALTSEIIQFFDNAGVRNPLGFTGFQNRNVNDANIDALLNLTGRTASGQSSAFAWAMFNAGSATNPAVGLAFALQFVGSFDNSQDQSDIDVSTTFGLNGSAGNIGSWLVRQSSVPEPATLALISFGLVGLGFNRRRRCVQG